MGRTTAHLIVANVTSAWLGRGKVTFWMLPNREHSLRILESVVTCRRCLKCPYVCIIFTNCSLRHVRAGRHATDAPPRSSQPLPGRHADRCPISGQQHKQGQGAWQDCELCEPQACLQGQVGQPDAVHRLAQVAAGNGSPRLQARSAGAVPADGQRCSSTAGRRAGTAVVRTRRARLAALAPPDAKARRLLAQQPNLGFAYKQLLAACMAWCMQ